MSYDYLLYRPAPGAGEIPEGPADLVPLGTFEAVAAQVEGVFPGIVWRDRDARLWWGFRRDPPDLEVWLHVGMKPGDTLVESLRLTPAHRRMVEHAAEALGLVALDAQKGEVHRGGRPGWRR